jgi:hypothetical protein
LASARREGNELDDFGESAAIELPRNDWLRIVSLYEALSAIA